MALTKKQRQLVIIGVIVGGALLLALIFKPVIVLRPGQHGVIENKITGMEKRVLQPGWNWIIPGVQVAYKYNTRIQTYTVSRISDEGEKYGDDAVEVLTADGQKARLDLSIIYQLQSENLDKFHELIQGRDYREQILRPILRSHIRTIISKYSAIELYSSNPEVIAADKGIDVKDLDSTHIGRAAIERDILTKMQKELKSKYILVDSILLREVRFSEKYQETIEQKQIAQEEAKRMINVLKIAEKEKEKKIIEAEGIREAKIIEAQGEAEAISLKGQALRRNPAVISFEYVQKLSPNIKGIITDNKTILNLSDFLKE